MSDTDISREACERTAQNLHRYIQKMTGIPAASIEADLILALRAALDRAESNTAAAVEAMREACAAVPAEYAEAARKKLGEAQSRNEARDWALIVTRCDLIHDAIRALPSPAPMTVAQAARVPEVAALIYAASCVNHDNLHGNGLEGFRSNRERLSRAITAITEPRP